MRIGLRSSTRPLEDSFLKSLKDFFEALDTDGNGAIHLDEIKIMLQDGLQMFE